MKVILLRAVEGLGREGEVRDVSAGYARNFLIPRQLADIATPELIEQLEGKMRHQEKKAKHELLAAEQLASAIEGKRFEIHGKASKEGTLYAAINASMISEELKKHGYLVSDKNIITKGIKEAGDHEISIKLGHGIEAKIQLAVNSVK